MTELEIGEDDDEEMDVRRTKRQRVIDVINGEERFVGMLNGELCWYDRHSGVWRGDEWATRRIIVRAQSELGRRASVHEINEIKATIVRLNQHSYNSDEEYWDNEDIEGLPEGVKLTDLVAVKNGVLNIQTETLYSHHPKYRFRTRANVWFIPRTDERLKDKVLVRNFFSDVHMGRETDINGAYEWFGYCLYRRYHIHKAEMLVGGGNNGKTTWLNLLEDFLGKENVSNESLQTLCTNRFAAAQLRGKSANIYDDLTDEEVENVGMFKMGTGYSPISAEVKHKQVRFQFYNTAKMAFACNKIPKAKDSSDAFFRRWVIIRFNHVFVPGGDEVKDIILKLTNPLEKSALLLDALDGLRRLLKTGKFSNEESVEEVRELIEVYSEPIEAFVSMNVVHDTSLYVPKRLMYDKYVAFCKDKNVSPIHYTLFGRRLKEHLKKLGWAYKDNESKIVGDGRVDVYTALCLNGIKRCQRCSEIMFPDMEQVVRVENGAIHKKCYDQHVKDGGKRKGLIDEPSQTPITQYKDSEEMFKDTLKDAEKKDKDGTESLPS
jgi:P4 family phage/plasmid primase-like protien